MSFVKVDIYMHLKSPNHTEDLWKICEVYTCVIHSQGRQPPQVIALNVSFAVGGDNSTVFWSNLLPQKLQLPSDSFYVP